MHDPNQPTKPDFFPAEKTLDYWRKFLTLVFMILAFPYMVRMFLRNPGRAAALSSAV